MPTLINTLTGFEFKRTDTNASEWATVAGAPNFHQYVQANVAILGGTWGVDYGSGSVTTEYTGAYQFSGMSLGGNAVATATLTLPFARLYKENRAYIHGVLNANMGVAATGNLPSAQALTTARVAFNNNPGSPWESTPPFDAPPWSNFSATSWYVPDVPTMDFNITAILNELRQDPSFTEGDPITLVWVDEVVPNFTGVLLVPNLSNDLGLPEASITFTTGAAAIPDPTSSVSTSSFIEGTVVTVTTTNVTTASNGVVTVNGISQAQTLTAGDNQHTFTFNRGILPNGSGTYVFSADGDARSQNITVSPSGGLSFINVVNPNTTEASLLHAVSANILAGAMQFEFNPVSSNNNTVTLSARGVPSINVGTGTDQMFFRFWSAVTGYWDDLFTAEFRDLEYIGTNKIDPIPLVYTFNAPIFIAQAGPGDVPVIAGDLVSINAPSILILDKQNTIDAYVDRDNTAEFRFLESGVTIDLNLVTEIILKVGGFTFSDSIGAYTDRFKRGDNAFLEVNFGELGLPVGSHNFYFILYTSTHTQGIVWNVKEDYIVNIGND